MRRAGVTIVGLGVLAAVVPLPRGAVERWYSTGLFPRLQRFVTPLSNAVPIAIFDLLLITAVAATAVLFYRRVHRDGWTRGLRGAFATMIVAASVAYLVFLCTWGLNYRRVPLSEKVDFSSARVSLAAAHALGDMNAATLNRLYGPSHRGTPSLESLADAFHRAQRQLGSSLPIVPARPKQTLLGAYFHQTSISGMTDPFLLETLLAPDLLDVERPFVIAHEWAHLAGYADEAEANYVAWLACRHGDDAAQYSAALSLIGYAAPSRPLATVLDMGPRVDLFAIQRRYAETSPALRAAARESYDKYLKANRVERGVESYDLVVQLILGTALDDQGYPRRR